MSIMLKLFVILQGASIFAWVETAHIKIFSHLQPPFSAEKQLCPEDTEAYLLHEDFCLIPNICDQNLGVKRHHMPQIESARNWYHCHDIMQRQDDFQQNMK